MKQRRCLTPEEYAAERRVSLRTVYRLIHAKAIPAERVGHQWRIWLVNGANVPQEGVVHRHEQTPTDTTAKV